jgi:hypothetical protein
MPTNYEVSRFVGGFSWRKVQVIVSTRRDREPALRMSEQPGGLDDAHFPDVAGLGALQSGEDGRCCVAQGIWIESRLH